MTCVCVLARARMSACAGGREKEGELLWLLVAGRLGGAQRGDTVRLVGL